MHIYYSYAKLNSQFQPELDLSRKVLDFLENTDHLIFNAYENLPSDSKQLFLYKKSLIEKSDCLIVEVTKPSTDLGGEIVYGLTLGKPILALIYGENNDKITPMLIGNPSSNLFVEHYDFKSLNYSLKRFLSHANYMLKSKGKLVIIDGGDGSGKATQAKLLTKYLDKQKASYRIYDFPRYYSSFHGATVGRLLAGEFGELNSLSPYLASLAYALDRASVREEMVDYLKSGGLIICNRYTTSSMAHWGGRFNSQVETQKYLKWLYELEYKVHQMPKEDMVIYLYVPWTIGLKLTNKKAYRVYTKGVKLDIVEKSIEYRIKSEKMFLALCKKNAHWHKLECVDTNNHLFSRSNIHQKIVKLLKAKKLIK